MDKKEIMNLKQDIDNLLNGIDPQSNTQFGDDSVLKSEYNKNVLKKASLILDYLIKVGLIPAVDKRVKFDFYLTSKQKEMIEISEEPISISKFVYNINDVVNTLEMKKLPATAITGWLTQHGYLESTTNADGMEFKVLTEKSAELGLTCQEKTNSYGNKYSVNLYPAKAQQFILENLDRIADYYSGKFDIPIE